MDQENTLEKRKYTKRDIINKPEETEDSVDYKHLYEKTINEFQQKIIEVEDLTKKYSEVVKEMMEHVGKIAKLEAAIERLRGGLR